MYISNYRNVLSLLTYDCSDFWIIKHVFQKKYTFDNFITGCMATMTIPILPITGFLVGILFMTNIIYIGDRITDDALIKKFAIGFGIGIRATILMVTDDKK